MRLLQPWALMICCVFQTQICCKQGHATPMRNSDPVLGKTSSQPSQQPRICLMVWSKHGMHCSNRQQVQAAQQARQPATHAQTSAPEGQRAGHAVLKALRGRELRWTGVVRKHTLPLQRVLGVKPLGKGVPAQQIARSPVQTHVHHPQPHSMHLPTR